MQELGEKCFVILGASHQQHVPSSQTHINVSNVHSHEDVASHNPMRQLATIATSRKRGTNWRSKRPSTVLCQRNTCHTAWRIHRRTQHPQQKESKCIHSDHALQPPPGGSCQFLSWLPVTTPACTLLLGDVQDSSTLHPFSSTNAQSSAHNLAY